MNTRARIAVCVAAAAIGAGGLTSTAGAAPAVSSTAQASADFVGAQGTYQQVKPARILDTRTGLGAPKAAVGANREISLLIAGRGGVPGGISSVVLNLTAVKPRSNTFLTAYPSGTARPSTSNLNVAGYTNRANLITVPVGSDGRVRIFNSQGSVNIVADVMGYYNALASPAAGIGSQYYTTDATRLYDSRKDTSGAFYPDEYVWVEADWNQPGGPDINSKVTAYAANITVLQGSRSGFVAAGPTTTPTTSTVNYAAGQVIANMAVVPSTRVDGIPGFYVTAKGPGTVHIIVDIVGVYTKGEASGLRYRALAPRRIVDTRSGVGGPARPLGSGEARLHTAQAGVAGPDTWALVANTTAARPTGVTWLTVYAGDDTRPTSSNLNAAAGETSANSTFTPLSAAKQFYVHNMYGSTPMIMDVFGTFDSYPSSTSAAKQATTQRSAGVSTRAPQIVGSERG